MKRTEILGKLEMLQPALASNELLPILTNFWFSEKSILAYNDRIGIVVPHSSPFDGGLHGNTLLGLLKNSGAQEVTLADRGKEVLITAAGAKINLALMEPEDVFTMPKKTGNKFESPTPALIAGVKRCLQSTTDDTSVPDQLGVTFHPSGKSTHLYSTTGHIITRVIVPGSLEKRAILSAEFCKQLVALAPSDKMDLEITSNYALLTTAKASLYGRLIEAEQPLPFAAMYERHFPDKVKKTLIPIPAVLKRAIERSLVMAAHGDGEARIELSVNDNELKLVTKAIVGKSVIGTITDTVELDDKHPKVKAEIHPKSIKAGIDDYTHMAITEECIIMHNEGAGATLLASTAAN